MNAIKHRIVIETTPDLLFKALTDPSQLSRWWARCRGSESASETITFYFGTGDNNACVMRVAELAKNQKVVWVCEDGPWIETEKFEFLIMKDPRGVALEFRNTGWPENEEFFMHCNAKWGFFLGVSLKNLLESGTGQPNPLEPAI